MIFPSQASSGNEDDEWGRQDDPYQTVGLLAPNEASPLFEALARTGVRFRFEPTQTLLPGASLSGSGVDKPFTALPMEECFLIEVHEDDLEAYEAIRNEFSPSTPIPGPDHDSASCFGEEPSPFSGPLPDHPSGGLDAVVPAGLGEKPSPPVDDTSDGPVFRDIGSMFIVVGLFLVLVALFQELPDDRLGISIGFPSDPPWIASPWIGWAILIFVSGCVFRLVGGQVSSSQPSAARPGAFEVHTSPPERIVVLKCLACGTHNPEDSKFCRQCGSAY